MKETGKTRLQTYLDIERQTGVRAAALDEIPPLPFEAEQVWQWFGDLNRARGSGMVGPESLSWSDVCAYFQLLGFRPSRWELEALSRLDDKYIASRLGGDAGRGKLSNAKALRRNLTGDKQKD